MEGPLDRIDTRLQKISQDMISIGGTDQFVDRQTKLLSNPAGQNITEIAGRYGIINGIAKGNRTAVHQLCIGRIVVYDLRDQAADIDAVGRGQSDTV